MYIFVYINIYIYTHTLVCAGVCKYVHFLCKKCYIDVGFPAILFSALAKDTNNYKSCLFVNTYPATENKHSLCLQDFANSNSMVQKWVPLFLFLWGSPRSHRGILCYCDLADICRHRRTLLSKLLGKLWGPWCKYGKSSGSCGNGSASIFCWLK